MINLGLKGLDQIRYFRHKIREIGSYSNILYCLKIQNRQKNVFGNDSIVRLDYVTDCNIFL